MKQLRVWGGLTFKGGKQVRTIVATRTKKRAMELLKASPNTFKDYWSETGNAVEIATALPKPDTIFIASTSMGNDFIEV